MEDLNDESASPQRPSMADDLLLEIIERLPLKKATQCSVLNKSLRDRMSEPQFKRRRCRATTITICRCSAGNPKYFTRLPSAIMSPSGAASPVSYLPHVNLEREASILASCEGILLLRIKPHSNKYHVFNPITGAIMPFDSDHDYITSIGLAVDVANSPFNLVALDLNREPDRTVVEFSILAPRPDDGRSMHLKSRVEFIAPRSFTLEADRNILPVYAAGSLYWLGDNGAVMLAFDVKKQRARISDGPLANEDQTGNKWFGPAGGSIRFVHAMRNYEIMIYGHDGGEGEWRIEHRIENISNGRWYGQLVNFEGDRLFFFVREYAGEGKLHIYNVLREKWEERFVFSSSSLAWLDSNQHYFSFMPTMAKVSDFYLKDLKKMEMKEKEKNEEYVGFHDTLLGLHRLLSPTAN